MGITAGDSVKIEYIGKFENGDIFDTSKKDAAKDAGILNDQRKYEPLAVEMGQNQIIPGLEEALMGMQSGEQKEVTIPAVKAYGEKRDDLVQGVPVNVIQQFNVEPEVGLMLNTSHGMALITKVTDDEVVLDFNHPLAGKTLVFDVTIVEIQKAS